MHLFFADKHGSTSNYSQVTVENINTIYNVTEDSTGRPKRIFKNGV